METQNNSVSPYTYVYKECGTDITCPSCKNVCLDPIILKCCGTYYCRGCIMNNTLANCLVCNKRVIMNDVYELDPIRDKFVIGKFFNPAVQCNYCCDHVVRGLKGELFNKHYAEVCPIPCPNSSCYAKLTRSSLVDHKRECQYETAFCKAKDAGCQFQGLRKDVVEHEMRSPSCHIAVASLSNKIQEAKIANLEQKVQHLETQLFQLLTEKARTAKWTGTPTTNGVLTNNNMTCNVLKDSAIFTGSEGWVAGVHQWIVECDIDEASVMVGIFPYISPSNKGKSIYMAAGGYFIYTANGCKYSQGLADIKTDPPLKTQYMGGNYQLKVRLDCDKRTLSFANNVNKDGSDIWVTAYENLPMTQAYYPTVELIYLNHKKAANPKNSVTYIPEY